MKAQTVRMSKICDPADWELEPGVFAMPFPCREGAEYVAGPFDTPEEMQAVLNLLMTPAEGSA